MLIDRVLDILDFRGLAKTRASRAAEKAQARAAAIKAHEDWINQKTIDGIVAAIGPATVAAILAHAGYGITREGKLVQRPGRCEACRDHHILQIGKSGRWLCATCHAEELCST